MRKKKNTATLALLASLAMLAGTGGANLPGSLSSEELARWSDRALESESWRLLRRALDEPWWAAWITARRLDQVNNERLSRIAGATESAREPDAVSSSRSPLDRP